MRKQKGKPMKTLKGRADEMLRIINGWKVDTYINDWGAGVAELVNEANEDFSIYGEETQNAINAIPQLIKDLTARNAELEAQRGWKPIAEMPEELKDGRMVLGYSKIESPSWFFMHWSDFKDSSIVACDGFWFCGIHTKKPTHYMQIPEVDDAV